PGPRLSRHSLRALGRWNLSRPRPPHRHYCYSRRALLLGHRRPHQRILRLLPAAHRLGLWRVPRRGRLPPVRLLRDRHHPQVLPHRHLGFHPPRVRRDEAGHLLVRRLRHGPWRNHCRLRSLRGALHLTHGPRLRLGPPVAALPTHRFPRSFRRIRHPRRPLAVPHMGAHWTRSRAHRCLHAPRRSRHEARRLRLPPRRYDALPPRPRPMGAPAPRPALLARPLRPARRHRHRLRSARRSRPTRLQIRYRLFLRLAYGVHPVGPDDAEPHRTFRRSAADDLARSACRTSVRRRRPHGLRAHAHPRARIAWPDEPQPRDTIRRRHL